MEVYSATSKGPLKELNQDYCTTINQDSFSLIVVADGLGSAKNSDIGSKMAAKAVKKAILQWRTLKNKKEKVLIRLIHFYWAIYIDDLAYEKKDCQTTCLFTYFDKKSKSLLMGHLGDGIILFNSPGIYYISKSNDDFNFTKSLGKSQSIDDWNLKLIDYDVTDFICFLSTDGVSEDLVLGKENKFALSLKDDMIALKRQKRNKYLKDLIINWPTKYHTDDKSICIAWNKKRKIK